MRLALLVCNKSRLFVGSWKQLPISELTFGKKSGFVIQSKHFATHSKKYPTVLDGNPFDILGIPRSSSYQEVKRQFVELALKHHPDLATQKEDGDADAFVRFRQAFEHIRDVHFGNTESRQHGKEGSGWSDEEFQAWFYEETGHSDVSFRMDMATRREVIETANSQSQGGLDRGGMWEMARAMAEQANNAKHQKSGVQGTIGIDSGITTEPATSPRRRRRK